MLSHTIVPEVYQLPKEKHLTEEDRLIEEINRKMKRFVEALNQ